MSNETGAEIGAGWKRTGEKAGRAAERLATRERNDAIHRQMLDAASRRPHDRGALADRLRDGRF